MDITEQDIRIFQATFQVKKLEIFNMCLGHFHIKFVTTILDISADVSGCLWRDNQMFNWDREIFPAPGKTKHDLFQTLTNWLLCLNLTRAYAQH